MNIGFYVGFNVIWNVVLLWEYDFCVVLFVKYRFQHIFLSGFLVFSLTELRHFFAQLIK